MEALRQYDGLPNIHCHGRADPTSTVPVLLIVDVNIKSTPSRRGHVILGKDKDVGLQILEGQNGLPLEFQAVIVFTRSMNLGQ